MQLTVDTNPLEKVAAECLIVGQWQDVAPDPVVTALDGALGGALTRLRQAGDLTGKALELTPVLVPAGVVVERLLVVGLGLRSQADFATLHDAAAAALRAVTSKQRGRIALALPEPPEGLDWAAVTLAVGTGAWQGCFGPGLFKREPSRYAPRELVLVAPPAASVQDLHQAAQRAAVEGQAVALARELVNMPPSDLYPQTFADRARQLARGAGVECTVLDEKELEAERMGAILAVGRGSARPPRLVVLRYPGAGSGRMLGLVGKGVTFDSGGLSLKTTEQMVDMKCDMAGAAAVLTAITAAAELHLPVNLLGVLPLVENLPGGRAMKLGDVLRTRDGKTVEVVNTDAEGRLILADALNYAIEQKTDHLLDLATLTGACLVALGTEVAGLMTNNDAWGERVLSAARRVGEKVWPLPMWPHYAELIKSDVADLKNSGGTRYGGAITAAKFLEQFVGPVPWAHLDIAGPAWAERESACRDAGGTGCFVRTLVELARGYSE